MKSAAAGLDIMGVPQGDQVKDCRKLGQTVAGVASSRA
jgi:hypothetical protein